MGSYGSPPCVVCKECGTTLASHPDHHAEPEPHEMVTRYHPTTGKPYQVCKRFGCSHRDGYAEAGNP